MKTCNVCGESKALSDFYKEKAMVDGYRKTCKACKNKSTAMWRKRNREKYNADMRSYNKTHYHKLRLQRYDLTVVQYEALLLSQNWACAICEKAPQTKTKRPLNIDHHHISGKTRGLLCHRCNRDIVILDNPEKLAKAMSYLEKHSKDK